MGRASGARLTIRLPPAQGNRCGRLSNRLSLAFPSVQCRDERYTAYEITRSFTDEPTIIRCIHAAPDDRTAATEGDCPAGRRCLVAAPWRRAHGGGRLHQGRQEVRQEQ